MSWKNVRAAMGWGLASWVLWHVAYNDVRAVLMAVGVVVTVLGAIFTTCMTVENVWPKRFRR